MIALRFMTVKTFVDTNVLVYAYDRGAGNKHLQARRAIGQLWDEGTGALSTQVLQEFYVNVWRKSRRPISIRSPRSLVAVCMLWDPVVREAAPPRYWVRTIAPESSRSRLRGGSPAPQS